MMPTTSMMNVILRHPRQEISRLQLPYFAGVVPRWLLEINSVVEYRGIVQNEYGIGGVLHISISLHQQLPSHQNAILLQTSQLASAQTRGEKERKISLARFQLSRHTTHKRTKKKKSKTPWRCTSYLFLLLFTFFFLHMHACMPAEQKKAQDRTKKKEISNRNCKAGNLDTACRLPLQELINRYLPTSCTVYIAYLTFILLFLNFSFLFWGFRIDSRVPVPVPVPKLS